VIDVFWRMRYVSPCNERRARRKLKLGTNRPLMLRLTTSPLLMVGPDLQKTCYQSSTAYNCWKMHCNTPRRGALLRSHGGALPPPLRVLPMPITERLRLSIYSYRKLRLMVTHPTASRLLYPPDMPMMRIVDSLRRSKHLLPLRTGASMLRLLRQKMQGGQCKVRQPYPCRLHVAP
jgi:hypothetical protein